MVQEAWRSLQQSANEAAEESHGTLLLRAIANSAARFPGAQAAELAADLLKVRSCICHLTFRTFDMARIA